MEHLILTGLCLKPETISSNGGFRIERCGMGKSMGVSITSLVHSVECGFFNLGGGAEPVFTAWAFL